MCFRRYFFPLISVLCFLFLLPATSHSSPKQKSKQPKICLVLKGGGALGLAHVGVLKVLEKNRIPIHCIAGTSMGSIVGASYASGNTIEELEHVLSTIDWDELFGENISRQTRDYRLKPGRNREIYGDAKISYKNGELQSPTGLIQGQNIRPTFQGIFGDLPTPVDFDSLPIPFRAVAADIETGEQYIPSKGDLASLVRASMSVPAAFAPVEIDGKLLVDGGIANNLPVDVALNMGADVLIVVDLISDLAKGKDLTSPLSVTSQMVSLLILQNSVNSRKLVRTQDIVIEPNVNPYTALEFNKSKELIKIGEDEANRMLPQLQRLSVNEEEYLKYSASRTNKKVFDKKLDFVEFKGKSHMSKGRIKNFFRLKAGDLFSRKTIEEDINKLYQTGYFQSVQYSLVQQGVKEGLEIDIKQKEWLDNFIRFGFALEDDLEGNESFRLGLAYRMNTRITKDGYVELKTEIGRIPRISLELYQPIGSDSPYFINPIIGAARSELIFREGDQQLAEYARTEKFAALNLGRKLGTSGEATIGIVRSDGKLERQVGDPLLPEFDYDVGDLISGFVLDTLDKADFATDGYFLTTNYREALDDLGSSSDFRDLTGNVIFPVTFGRNTLSFKAEGAHTFGERPAERSFSLGGFGSVSGYKPNSLVAADYAFTQMIAFRRFSEIANPLFNLSFFMGGTFELTNLANDNQNLEDQSLITSGSIFVGGDTPIIPAYLSFGLADTGDSSLYIVLGRIGRSGRSY